MKHLSTKQLWVQEAAKSYSINVDKIRREDNIVDTFTHEVPAHSIFDLVEKMYSKILCV